MVADVYWIPIWGRPVCADNACVLRSFGAGVVQVTSVV